MKNIFSLLTLFFSFIFLSGQISWQPIEKVLNGENSEKKTLLYFYDSSCKTCEKLKSTTFAHSEIISLTQTNYNTTSFDVSTKEKVSLFGKTFSPNQYKGAHDLVSFLSVTSTPAIVLLDESFMPLTTLQGNLSPRDLEPYLSFFSSPSYQKIKTQKEWENFQRKFKSKIKNED